MNLAQSSSPEDLLTSTDAARALNVSTELIRWLHNEGKLPALRTVSGTRLFRRSDVEALAAERAKGKKAKLRRAG